MYNVIMYAAATTQLRIHLTCGDPIVAQVTEMLRSLLGLFRAKGRDRLLFSTVVYSLTLRRLTLGGEPSL